jgi:hypothetical protein
MNEMDNKESGVGSMNCRQMEMARVAIEEMQREHDPLAVHIFVSRRNYRNVPDTKSGKRHHLSARLNWQPACELGFRGDLEEWERLLGAAPRRA